MRKLVINADLGFDFTTSEMIDKAAEAGWDGVFTGWNEECGNKQIAAKIKDAGLLYQSVHAPFGHADSLWEEDEQAECEFDRQIRCLRNSAECGVPIVVMHAIIGMKKNSPSDIGIERFARLLDEAAALGIKIALENTEGECYLEKIFTELHDHHALGFCIDTGHEMCYNYSRDIIGKYGDRLIATHLNDNMKMSGEELTWLDDSHLMPFDGLADWDKIAARLNLAGYAGPLTFELTCKNKPGRHTHDIYSSLDADGFLQLARSKAETFREIIDKK